LHDSVDQESVAKKERKRNQNLPPRKTKWGAIAWQETMGRNCRAEGVMGDDATKV
jgi:hypothetical protein